MCIFFKENINYYFYSMGSRKPGCINNLERNGKCFWSVVSLKMSESKPVYRSALLNIYKTVKYCAI